MRKIAIKLANGFPFVRIDLYNINGKIIFGELNFYPSDSRWPYLQKEYNKIIGDYMTLPKIPEDQSEITTT